MEKKEKELLKQCNTLEKRITRLELWAEGQNKGR